jgi:hypothetical protein
VRSNELYGHYRTREKKTQERCLEFLTNIGEMEWNPIV